MYLPYRRLSRLRYKRDILSLHEAPVDETIQADDVAGPPIDVPTGPAHPNEESVREDTPLFDDQSSSNECESDQEATEADPIVDTGKV